MKLFNELVEISLAKYAYELRPIIRRALVKLSTEMDLSNEDISTIEVESRKLVHETRLDNKKDTRYWKEFRDLFVKLVCLMKKTNKLGTPATLDSYILGLYDPTISGYSLSSNIYKIIKLLNDNGAKTDHGVLCSIGQSQIEFLPSPQSVIVGDDECYFYTWGVVGSISDPEFTKEDPGIYIRGTALGVGDEGGEIGTNKLNYCPIANGEMTNNVNPERFPDVFGYIYTSTNTNASMTMNRVSIPTGEATSSVQCWYRIVAPYNDYWHRINDYRDKTYQWCNWKGTLTAGTYKLIAECANPYEYYLPQNNPNPTMSDEKSYYALVDENDNVLAEVKWDEFFVSGNDRPVWTRKETEFTISSTTNVGVIAKMYYAAGTGSLEIAWRYMIVPADTVNTQFTVETGVGVTITGESCWEPYYKTEGSITVKFTNLSDKSEYTKVIPMSDKLYDTVMTIPLTSEISEHLSSGPVRIEIVSSDSSGNHGSLSTYYMR